VAGYVGHTGQIERAGDRFPGRAGHIPIAVVRDEQNDLHAFLNVCRHRGAEVVRESGSRKTLQCHYHAWTYGLDGSPNTRINVFPGSPNLSIGPALPDGPERTTGYHDYFFGPEVTHEEKEELIAFDSQVGAEDRVLVESVQRGMRAGLLGQGAAAARERAPDRALPGARARRASVVRVETGAQAPVREADRWRGSGGNREVPPSYTGQSYE